MIGILHCRAVEAHRSICKSIVVNYKISTARANHTTNSAAGLALSIVKSRRKKVWQPAQVNAELRLGNAVAEGVICVTWPLTNIQDCTAAANLHRDSLSCCGPAKDNCEDGDGEERKAEKPSHLLVSIRKSPRICWRMA